MLLEEVAAAARQHGISLLAPMFILDTASVCVCLHSHARQVHRFYMTALPTTSWPIVRSIRNPNPRASWWQRDGVSIILHSHTSWLAVKFLCLAGVGLKQ